jgi:hypothetical protein
LKIFIAYKRFNTYFFVSSFDSQLLLRHLNLRHGVVADVILASVVTEFDFVEVLRVVKETLGGGKATGNERCKRAGGDSNTKSDAHCS